MKKRWLSIYAIMAMILVLAACSNENNLEDKNENDNSTTEPVEVEENDNNDEKDVSVEVDKIIERIQLQMKSQQKLLTKIAIQLKKVTLMKPQIMRK